MPTSTDSSSNIVNSQDAPSANQSQSVFGHHSQQNGDNSKIFRSKKGSFSSTKAKYFLGGLALSLLMIAGGVAYNLVQQEGVGDIRQQASEEEFPLFEDFDSGNKTYFEGWRTGASNSNWGSGWGRNEGKYTLNTHITYDGEPSISLHGKHIDADMSRYHFERKEVFEQNKDYVIKVPVYIPEEGNDFSDYARPEVLVQCWRDGQKEQPVDFNRMPINRNLTNEWQVVAQSFKQTKSDPNNCYIILSVSKDHKALFGPVEIYEDTGVVTNGSFENGLEGWEITTDSNIPATAEEENGEIKPNHGNKMLKLAEKRDCSDYPIGFVSVAQSMYIPQGNNVLLFFRYAIYSEDASVEDSYDRFEIWFNDSELKFKDGSKINEGLNCDVWRRIPGLENPRKGQVSGWAFESLKLRDFADQKIKISFRNYWRYDNWYSTYTYIDDVKVVKLLKTLTYSSSFPPGWSFSVSDPSWNELGQQSWTADEGIGAVQNFRAKSGNALRLTSKNPNFDSYDSLVQLCKPLDLQAGSYSISASINLLRTAGENRFSRPGILIQQRGGNYQIYHDFKNKFSYTTQQWQDIAGEFVIESDQTNNQICLQALNNSDVVFDDIKIERLEKTWTLTAACADGSIVENDELRMFRILWPGQSGSDFNCEAKSFAPGSESMTITSTNLNNGVYFGVELPTRDGNEADCSEGTSFEPISIEPNSEAVTFSKYMNPYNWMAHFKRDALPEGSYIIKFDLPGEYCGKSQAPLPPPIDPAECATNADCSDGQVCHPDDEICVTPACTNENVNEVCPDLSPGDERSDECVVKACTYPDTYRAACAFLNISNESCADEAGTCQAGRCIIDEDGEEPESEEMLLSLIISPDGVPYIEGEVRHHPQDHGEGIDVQVSLINTKDSLVSKKVTFAYNAEIAAYQTTEPISYSNFRPGPYIIGLKGPMHLAKSYCFFGSKATEACSFERLVTSTLNYDEGKTVPSGFIVLEPGEILLDFKRNPLPVGDLPISGASKNSQDGRVNVYDYSFMLSCIGEKSRTEACVARADVDFSGQVNNIDLGLLRKTLSEVADQL